jgi:hypothetical protein
VVHVVVDAGASGFADLVAVVAIADHAGSYCFGDLSKRSPSGWLESAILG